MTDRELLELLLQKVTGLENKISGMENKISGMENRMSGLENRMSELENRMSGLEEDIQDIKKTMATKGDVADIPAMKVAIFETADTIKRIENTQEKHERTLDLLARRSIDQEAELKRIK